MSARVFHFCLRWLAVWLLASAGVLGAAANRHLSVNGGDMAFEDASVNVTVTFRSMRLNRALNVWNVDVVVSNRTDVALTAPVALVIEGWTNTTGVVRPAGLDTGDGKPFLVMPTVNETLAAGQTSTKVLELGVSGARAPTIGARVFSAVPGVTLALVRTLDAIGQPLPDVLIEETGPLGARSYRTDAEAGVATVGQGAGPHVWKFSVDGYLPVWRTLVLTNGKAQMLASPRLVKPGTNVALAAGIPTTFLVDSNLQGQVIGNGLVRVTRHDGQSMPALLPRGWNPLSAFTLEFAVEPAVAGALTQAIPAGLAGQAALAKLDEETASWMIGSQVTSANNSILAELKGSGRYAFLVRDPELGSTILTNGAVLPGAAAGGVDLVATGVVAPPTSPPSRTPELVTAQARVTVTNRAGALPSGLVLFGEISERYLLRDGTRRFPPRHDEFLTAYRGAGGANSTVEANFALRPILLFGGEDLLEATVRVDVSAPTNFSGGVFGLGGGVLANGGVTARAVAGDVATPQAVMLRELSAADFVELGAGGSEVVAGAELTIGGLASERSLKLDFGSQAVSASFVLGKILWRDGVYGVEPRERFSSDAAGKLTSLEPATGARLAGVTGSGQYLLLKVPSGVAVVNGNANETGSVATVEGQPWITMVDGAGKFTLVAPVGSSVVRVRNAVTRNEGIATVSPAVDLGAVAANVSLGLPVLRVASVSPTGTDVSRVAAIVVNFSEAINPATLLSNLRLLGTNGEPVLGSFSLNLKNTSATFLPQAQLAPSTTHTIDLGGTIAAPDGRTLTGARSFTFKTETDQLNRPPPQLISYEPVNGIAALSGTPGTADSESPVILVNETSGQTATILSKVDGSFTNNIEAGVDDILSAVLVNKNGTRTTIPVSRQIFRDGSVGLFSSGGILEAESDGGPVQVIVEPGSIDTKTKFKVTPISMQLLQSILANPPSGEVKVLGGMMLTQEGDDLKIGADVSFPIDVTALNLTNAPEKASWALAVPREDEDGTTTYEIVDRMLYENGKLVTHSPPFTGALLKELQRRFKEAKKFDKLNKKIMKVLGLPDLKTTFYNQALLPLLMSQGTSLIVQGKVVSSEPDANNQPVPGKDRLLPGATITFAVDEFVDRPGRLNPGATFTTTGSDGTYAFLFPINRLQENGFEVRATHPAFPFQRAAAPITVPSIAQQFNAINNAAGSLGGGLLGAISAIATAATTITPKVNANMILFRNDTTVGVDASTDDSPPTISMTVTPRDPGPGTNTTDGAMITVSGADDFQVGTITLTVADQTPLSPLVTNNVTPLVLLTTTNIGTKVVQSTYRLKSRFRANVHLHALVNDTAGNSSEAEVFVNFAGDRVFPPVTNPNDLTGPRVLTTFPRNYATGVRPGQAISLEFSEAVAATNMTNVTAWLTVGGGAKLTSAELSRDGKQLTIGFSPEASGLVTITITSGLTDLNGNAFDQDPVTSGSQSFTMQFTVVNDTRNFPGIASGGGTVMAGAYAYLLERTGQLDGSLAVYDISGNNPVKVGEIGVPGYPRDLAMIPNYSFVVKSGGAPFTKNLVAVVGGKTGSETIQYLWVIDVSDPAHPTRLASANISLAISAVTKVEWSAPFLVYLESGADITSVAMVNLQEFIVGMNASNAEAAAFPAEGIEGVDLNGDGDFVDAGETVPIPMKLPTEFFGKEFSIVDPDTNRRIEDFDFTADQGLLGIVMSKGFKYGNNGLPDTGQAALPAYRTVFAGLGPVDSALATVTFTNDTPKRVALFFQVLLEGGTNTFRNLAVVSLTSSMAVIDITAPTQPKIIATIDMAAFGAPQTLTRRADGLLAVATQADVYLFNPAKFLLPLVNGLPPSLVGVIPGAGSGARSYVVDNTGINIVNLGGRHTIDHTAPNIQFLSFPNSGPFDPGVLATQSAEAKAVAFRGARLENVLEKTRLFVQTNPTNPPVLAPINTNALYYIRVDGIGSLAGISGTVDLVVESMGGGGMALQSGGGAALPVRLASTNTLNSLGDTNYQSTNALAYRRSMKAVRMSIDPGSAYYNVFLGGPFVLTDTPLASNQLAQVSAQWPRAILRAGRFLWAGFDPTALPGPYSTNILSSVANKKLLQGDATVINVANIAKPLIFIPGIAGSYLDDKDVVLPFKSEYWVGYGIDSQQRKLSLKNPTGDIVASDVIRSVIRDASLVKIYGPILEYLTNDVGYVEYDYRVGPFREWAKYRNITNALTAQIPNNPNLFIYPYDWRKDNAQSAAELKEYLRLIRMFNPEVEQVDIVAHSMGGLVARRFTLDNPGVVDKFVSIGTPWLGAPKAIAALETGDFDDLAMNILIKKATLKELGEYFPGVHHLLPSKAYFDIGGVPLVEGSWDLNKNGTNFQSLTYNEYKAVMDHVFHTNGIAPATTNETFHGFSTALGMQDDWRTDGSGATYYHIYGVQAAPRTIGQVKANLRLRPVEIQCNDLSIDLPIKPGKAADPPAADIEEGSERYVLDRRLEFVRVAGDGTVPALSASRKANGLDFNAPGAVLLPIISPSPDQDHGSEHNGMLGNTKVLNYVRDILTGVIVPPTNSPPNPPEVFRVTLVNYEDGTVKVKDAGGETDEALDVPDGGSGFGVLGTIKKLIGKLILDWLTEEDGNKRAAQYDVVNVKSGNASHTLDFEAADGLPFSVDVEHITNGVTADRWRWVDVGPAGAEGQVKIDWQQKTATLKAGSGLTNVPATWSLSGAAAGDATPPGVEVKVKDVGEGGDSYEDEVVVKVTVTDNVATADQKQLYVGYDEDGDGDPFNNIYRKVKGLQPDSTSTGSSGGQGSIIEIHTSDLRPMQMSLLGADAAGNVSAPAAAPGTTPPTDNPDCATTNPNTGKTPLEDEKDALVAALQAAMNAAIGSEWTLSVNATVPSVLPGVNYILEQGSGACFWASGSICAACNGVFKSGVSDHDYEVFWPVFSNFSAGTPVNFANDPYAQLNVQGDWYFRPPTVSGSTLTYTKPGGGAPIVKTLPSNGLIRTPAQYLVEEMTAAAVASLSGSGHKETAKKLTLFAARAEHFQIGVIDLERPLELGSDATGDVGTGRQSLIMKWLLEGDYVAGVNGLTNTPPDLQTILTRMIQRGGINYVEGYEWGIYQEFAALSTGLLVRTIEVSGNAKVKPPQPDYFYDIKKKQIKYAGKAAIRAALGIMVAKADPASYLITRQEYQQKYRSFEQFIAGQAKAQPSPGIFGGFDLQLTNFYKAKIADDALLGELLHDDLKLNVFLASAVRFCRYVQTETQAGYQTALAAMGPDEKASRQSNLQKVLTGFPNLHKPGLNELKATPNLPLIMRVRNDGPNAAQSAEIKFESPPRNITATVNLAKDSKVQIPADSDEAPVFEIKDGATVYSPQLVHVTVIGPNGFDEVNVKNNWFGFYYYMLNVQSPTVPSAQSISPPSNLPTPSTSCQLDFSFP